MCLMIGAHEQAPNSIPKCCPMAMDLAFIYKYNNSIPLEGLWGEAGTAT